MFNSHGFLFLIAVISFFSSHMANANMSQLLANVPTSGYKYSTMSRMFENRLAAAFRQEKSTSLNVYAWTSQNDQATIHWQRADQYQETFKKNSNWILLSDWAAFHPVTGAVLNYHIKTKKAYLILNGIWHDISLNFAGGPHPYALENIPTQNYALYVEAEALEYVNGVKSANPNLQFMWYADYGSPQLRPSMFFGDKMSITQSEHWIDSNGENVRQSQTICQGIGLLCFGYPHNSTAPVGVDRLWFW